MKKATALAGVLALAILSGCSQKAPPTVESAVKASASQQGASDEAAPPPAPTAEQMKEGAPPPMDRAQKAAGLMTLLSTDPKCQSFHDQLDEAAKTPADVPLKTEMSQIVAQAHDAGCTR
jgi:hypothetical protein